MENEPLCPSCRKPYPYGDPRSVTRQQCFDCDLKLATFGKDYRPHRLMKSLAGVVWETISHPWIDGGKLLVNVRVPGDPTTMITADALSLSPEGRDCLCGNPAKPEYYFVDKPEDARRRAQDVSRIAVHS
jgi:hypothetical protein